MSDLDGRESEVPEPSQSTPNNPALDIAVTLVVVVPLVSAAEFLVQVRSTQGRIIGSLLAALWAAIAIVLDPQGIRRMIAVAPRLLRALWRRLWRRRYVTLPAAVVVLLLVAVPILVGALGGTAIGLPFCPEATQLRVLASPDELDATNQLVSRYEQLTAEANHNCPIVNMYVYAKDPSTSGTSTVTALANGWKDDGDTLPSRDIGPRPDIWFPASSADVARVEQLARQANQPVPVLRSDSIATSPVVLGVLGPSVPPRFGDHRPVPWRDMLAHGGELGGIVRADPRNSTGAAVGTLAMYLGEGWRPGDTSDNFSSLRQIEQQITDSLGTVGSQVEDTAALLCRLSRPSGPHPAVIASEQALLRFGDSGAPGCGPPAVKPLLVYPADTLLLDHPFVQFTWTRPRAARAVRAFRDWIDGNAGHDKLLHLGLRPANGTTDPGIMPPDRQGSPPPLAPHRSAPAGQPACGPVGQPTPHGTGPVLLADLDCAMETYLALQRPGHVLLAVDTSGSMTEPVGPAARTRSEVVASAVRRGLGQMGPTDEFGLWKFPRDSSGHGHGELVPVGKGSPAQRARVAAALSQLRPVGNTPLYATIADAVRLPALRADRDLRTALVVLTDGEDTSSGLTADDVKRVVKAANVRVFVVAVGEADCESSPVEGIAGGRCYHTDFTHIDGTLHQLFSVLWGGR